MPWAKLTHERMSIYKDVLGHVIGGERNIDMAIKDMLIRAELLKRDFTKRQLTIVMFIFTFSFAYGKESAYIPKLRDFEIAGISFKKVRGELNKLLKMNVIEWNKEDSTFTILDPKLWDCPYNKGYDDDRSRELFMLNLQHSGIDVSPLIKKLREAEK